ncbi:LamG domain-containing protein, partial [Candidatus Poribacteria bacterium]|nr:LamG domain-containing protein [Candidatus Poribacteria bacterium]
SGAGGYYLAGKMAPAGRIMVMDETNIYGFGRKPQYYQWTTPLEYQLFATNREIPEPKAPKTEVGSCIKVSVSESLNPTNAPLTVEAWIKAEKGNGVIIARGAGSNGYSLLLIDGKPHFMIRSNTKLSSVMADQNVVGKWCYLVGMLTSDKKLQIYINGNLAGSTDVVDLITGEPKQAMEIGADEGGAVGDYKSPFAFAGIIDEVRIYKREISKDEIQKHYTGTIDKTNQDPKLVLYFSFDNGDAKDDSGNNNNGTISDASSVAGKFGKAMKFTGATKSTQGAPEYVVKHNWKQDIPLQVRAMVLADKTLFIAGLPDILDEEDAQNRLNDPDIQEKLAEQRDALEGKNGALLWAVSTENGEKLAEYKLDSLPEWDGMAGAKGRLYFTTVDGKLMCFGK